jgi:hypothetical protein
MAVLVFLRSPEAKAVLYVLFSAFLGCLPDFRGKDRGVSMSEA